jgi:serine/threonine protein kinase
MEEVEILRKLQGSKIAAFLEAKPWKDRYIIVTKSYGRSLWDILRKRQYKPIREDLVFRYIEQLLQACDFMHSKGYAHTDIKPENILVEDMSNIN